MPAIPGRAVGHEAGWARQLLTKGAGHESGERHAAPCLRSRNTRLAEESPWWQNGVMLTFVRTSDYCNRGWLRGTRKVGC